AKLEGANNPKPLPGRVGRALGGRVVEETCQTIGALLLVVVLWSGFAGAQSAAVNLEPTFVFITFWVGFAFASVLFGNVFYLFNRGGAGGRAGGGVVAGGGGGRPPGHRPYPERLGRWPAAIGLLGFAWIELVSGYGETPSRLALAGTV